MKMSDVRVYMAASLLAGCGGGDSAEEAPPDPLQRFRTCSYQVNLGRGPLWIYRCRIAGSCDYDPCNPALGVTDPSCIPNQTTCTACPPGQLSC